MRTLLPRVCDRANISKNNGYNIHNSLRYASMHLRTFAVLLTGFVFIAGNTQGSDSPPSPDKLTLRALGQQDVWAKDMPSTKIRAEVTLQPEQAPAASGDYQLDWISQSQWREELRFANYSRGRIGVKDGYLQKGNLDYLPYFMFEFDSLIHPKDVLALGAKQAYEKTHRRSQNGAQLICVDVSDRADNAVERGAHIVRTICFDENSGSLVNVDYHGYEHRHTPYVSRIEYSDFRPVQGKLLPFQMRALHGGQTFMSFKILDVGNPPNQDSPIYRSRPDWQFWSQCDDMRIELKRKPKVFFQRPDRRREAGDVVFYSVVEPDGSVSHVRVIKGETERLDQAAAVGIQQWLYSPAVCDGKPVRTELAISVDFWFVD